jgi:hypothetical protein
MSVVKTIYGNLPEDLNRLSISSLDYASVYAQQVHDEVDKISGQLQAALNAGEISGIDANDFDDLTVKDASMLIEAIGRMPSTPLLSLRSISSASEDGLAGAVKQIGTLHDVFDKKGKGWMRMHTSIPEDDRQTNFQDHLQAIITQFTDVPSYDTVGETNLAQLAHRQGIQRMYSEALLHSCLRSSLPSFIKSVETQLKSRFKVKQGKTAKGFAGKALQKLEALSNVIDDIVNQTFVPASNVGESCKASLTQLPIQVEGDDLFHKLISVDGKTYTDRATNCTLSDAKVYGDALKRYARDRHDKVVEEQGELRDQNKTCLSLTFHRPHPQDDHPAMERRVFNIRRVVLRQGNEQVVYSCQRLQVNLGANPRRRQRPCVDGRSQAAGPIPQRCNHGVQSAIQGRSLPLLEHG